VNGAFQIGAIGLDAQQRALETIANNISNINTPAFKRSDGPRPRSGQGHPSI
jgi:flagellar basal-body rod protein FlgG